MQKSESENSLTSLNPIHNSDSSTSLTELIENKNEEYEINISSEKIIEKDQCVICMEEEEESEVELLFSNNIFNCTCKFHIHNECIKNLIKSKPDCKCPMCSNNTLNIEKIIPEELAKKRKDENKKNNKRLLIVAAIIGLVGIGNIAAFFI